MIANKDLQLITSSIGKRKRAVAFVELYEIKDNANPFTLINGIPPALYLQFNSQSLNTIFLPLEILEPLGSLRTPCNSNDFLRFS